VSHTDSSLSAIARDLLARGVAVVGLAGIALIHLLDSISTFQELPYKGVLYVLLIVGCLGTAGLLLRGSRRAGWLGATLLPAGAIVAYVYSRTVGLPGAADDIGNWSEPLGLAAMFVEACVVCVGAWALQARSAAGAAVARRAPAMASLSVA
jgi:hypothetical protein